ncbi:hypothetical protein ACFYO1_13125 [Nocardia sp. NPDC006044]|uniref:hypothetical protein n=1 Tax=Nocardia sp. NPDC006044 TaxID=3364306 RepID=UPI003689A170
MEPQFSGQHRAGRTGSGNDHIEHQGRAIAAAALLPQAWDMVYSAVAFRNVVVAALGNELHESAFREC